MTLLHSVGLVLGSGVVSSVATIFVQHRLSTGRDDRDRQLTYVREQVEKLYAPLHCRLVRNRSLGRQHDHIMAKYDEVFCKDWSENETTQSILDRETVTTINVANAYIENVIENNTDCVKLIQENWQFVDMDDMELMDSFILNHARLNLETERAKDRLPLRMARKVARIPLLDDSFTVRVEQKCCSKKDEISTPGHSTFGKGLLATTWSSFNNWRRTPKRAAASLPTTDAA